MPWLSNIYRATIIACCIVTPQIAHAQRVIPDGELYNMLNGKMVAGGNMSSNNNITIQWMLPENSNRPGNEDIEYQNQQWNHPISHWNIKNSTLYITYADGTPEQKFLIQSYTNGLITASWQHNGNTQTIPIRIWSIP